MEVYVARQPIFDKNKKIYGYELLFRDGIANFFPEIDGDTATSKVLSNSFFALGIDRITGGKRAFINFTRELLVLKIPTMFPREKIMVEILEDVKPDEQVVSACKEMAQDGYRIALDDFCYKPDLQPLIDLAKIVKIEFMLYSIEKVKEQVDKLAVHNVNLLAEKLENEEAFQLASKMGFEYFQGYFFSKPQVMEGKDIAPSKLSLLQIIAEVNKADFKFEELEKLIVRDVSTSYKLMRYINSAYFRRVQEISSIKQAITLLGEKEVRRFISLIALAQLASDKPDELIRTSIIRARFCELLGKYIGSMDESELFTVGLFSLIDAILDDTMANIMEKLPFSKAIKGALVYKEGELSDYLNLVSNYEIGGWKAVSETVTKIGVSEEKIPEFYMDAIGWADSYEVD
jgi:EAL and modified HD-GYP domain-containing signal transduction protein